MAEKKENPANKKPELPKGKTQEKTKVKILETQKPAATKEKTQKKTKVKILEMLRGTYGAFNPGETVELDSKISEAFIKGGFAEKN